MEYTEEQRNLARAELAKRELKKRKLNQNTQQEIPEEESSHPLKDIGIGLTHAGRNLHNLPHDVLSGIESLGDWYNSKDSYWKKHPNKGKRIKLSNLLPYDTQDYSDVFGMDKDKSTLLDQIIQGGVEHAPEIIGAAGLFRGGFRRLKGTHQLDTVQRAVNESGLQNFRYHPSDINEARNYMPPSHATEELIRGSESGQYGPSFSLQSQVGHHQRTYAKSPLASEQRLAPRAGELKQNMLDTLENALRNNGMHGEAELLRRGVRNFAQYTKIMEAVKPVLKKLGIPASIAAAIGFGFKKGKQLVANE